MSADVLQRLDQAGLLTPPQLADCLGLSACSGYRYHSGETELRYGQLRTLFHSRGGGREEVIRGLINPLIAGTGLYLVRVAAPHDINHDGDVNMVDSVQHSINADKQLAEIQESLVEQFAGGGQVDPRDVDLLEARVAAVIESATASVQIFRDTVERQSRVRRAARPAKAVHQ